MPPKKDPPGLTKHQKRKEPPSSSNSQNPVQRGTASSSHNSSRQPGRPSKRVKTLDPRTIATQPPDPALKNGELDLSSFLKSREFEIKALEDGMRRSKASRSMRAFQLVPRDMRRRTASHNVKRVPKRIRGRAGREMKVDNTPTVESGKRKARTTRGRIRAETAKRLGVLAGRKRGLKEKEREGKVNAWIETRSARPKIRRGVLNEPQKPKSKFRKRQIHKTWLPTHMWHAKRARITEPKNPLWRFSIPITPTEKSYRPTHRASGARGAVAWDMSYMSTIALEGPIESLEKILKSIGISDTDAKGSKWRDGKRVWNGWLSREVGDKRLQIGPSTIIWCSSGESSTDEADRTAPKRPTRRLFVRIHPAAFLETWTELLRLSKIQRPSVHIEDLRFEIGSINITGPGSIEALLGILHPFDDDDYHSKTFRSLAGLTNPATLPSNALLAFSIMDPRLHYPPRSTKLPKHGNEETQFALLEMLANWPVDEFSPSSSLFDRDARFKATRLPAQKSINRRKGQAPPGGFPSILPTDPKIPVMLFTSQPSSSRAAQGTWTLLAPWKCILPIWYGIVHYPLSTGGNPRFGGLDELRQIHFEQGIPWFPADYPGTRAGFAWEIEERDKRKREWEKRPKGKRIEWDSLDLGAGRKGEIGRGWACDFEKLIGVDLPESNKSDVETTQDTEKTSPTQPKREKINVEVPTQHLSSKRFTALLSSPDSELPPPEVVTTVRITLISRGVAKPCARIYRLPQSSTTESQTTDLSLTINSANTSPATTLQQWLSLLPPNFTSSKKSKPSPNPNSKTARTLKEYSGRIPLNAPLPQRIRLLAQSLLQNPPLPYPAVKNGNGEGGDGYPLVPGEEDLIGFVTGGGFCLAEGGGVAVGAVSMGKTVEGVRRLEKEGKGAGRLCIVRNAGEKMGRLARWESV